MIGHLNRMAPDSIGGDLYASDPYFGVGARVSTTDMFFCAPRRLVDSTSVQEFALCHWFTRLCDLPQCLLRCDLDRFGLLLPAVYRPCHRAKE